jgi:3-deoxy-7-phosphoheptulonate synthase
MLAMSDETNNLRVRAFLPLVSPRALKQELPITAEVASVVASARRDIEALIAGRDDRLLVIVGPCSIHDVQAASEYARHVARWRARHGDELLIVMRVYFEKPRTSVGWKGLINDPHLDGSCDLARGVRMARHLLLSLAGLGVPAATELLDPIVPQYIADLVAWAAIGARTTESQTHREMASGLSMPVGFKNGTDGELEAALNAMKAARRPHVFLGIDEDGRACVVRTRGNQAVFAVLRGGAAGPNYGAAAVRAAVSSLERAGVNAGVLIDCSHANSGKDYRRQPAVLADVAAQVAAGQERILGVMLESNLVAGRQELTTPAQLIYGQSITDACIDLEATEACLTSCARAVQARRALRDDRGAARSG